ncbi:RdgB/HAM1 family non-canonical purine NTP pyrophosphatase [Granulicoccus phenolivorans]|uniref:RdgB/HAM1 family non-canonical purine NTP pyrophosphatase n=1 Tax=Granulicoccus phenolivorans TaxID=266854 RepID=UPI00041B2B60|nr:RdgB/HAM1 family non-canonical purine NTP pyrophosphatase [Granulicoccus phenolivorans]
MTRLLAATNNAKKLTELRRVLAGHGIDVLALADVAPYPEPAETGRTFIDNALLKAREAVARTGLPAVADDSGLCVEILNQMPGVRSARWAGPQANDEANNELLLRQLADVPTEQRQATFRCALALVLPDGTERVTEGVMPGRIAAQPSGSQGFGYDPIFVADGQAVSNGVLAPAAKDAISHRGKAVRAMVPQIVELLGAGPA